MIVGQDFQLQHSNQNAIFVEETSIQGSFARLEILNVLSVGKRDTFLMYVEEKFRKLLKNQNHHFT